MLADINYNRFGQNTRLKTEWKKKKKNTIFSHNLDNEWWKHHHARDSLSLGGKNTNFPLLAIWTSLFFSPSLSLSLKIGVWILIIKVLRHNLRDNLLKITVNKMNIKFLMNSFLILYLGFIFLYLCLFIACANLG